MRIHGPCFFPGAYDVSVGLQELGPPENTPLPKGSFWEKYISNFSMTDREVIKPAGQNGSQE